MPPEDAELTAATRILEKRRELAHAEAEQVYWPRSVARLVYPSARGHCIPLTLWHEATGFYRDLHLRSYCGAFIVKPKL